MFNPNDHMMKLQNKDYLQVQWRLVWFRDAHPHGKITTKLEHLDTEKQLAVFSAHVEDGEGGVAEGYGSESAKDFKDYIEKASTRAVGRALATLGFGTQFCADELDERERLVDAPVERKPAPKPATDHQRLGRIKKRAVAVGWAVDKAQWDKRIEEIFKQPMAEDELLSEDIALIEHHVETFAASRTNAA